MRSPSRRLDQFNNAVPATTVNLNISPGTLSSGSTAITTGSLGLAVFSNLIEDMAGTYNLSVSATGIASVSSNQFTITAAAAALLTYVTQPGSTTAGTVISAVTVLVADRFGNIVTGTLVGVTISPGTLSGGTTSLTSDSTGQVYFTDLDENIVGSYTLSVSATGTNTAQSNPFTISAAAAAKLSFVNQPLGTTAGNTINAVTVKAVDTFGNVVPATTVNIAIAPGTLSAGTTSLVTNAAGLAIFTDLAEDFSGIYQLVASSGMLANVSSANFTIVSAAAAALSFPVEPSGGARRHCL